jgi:hypothetical protein
MDSVKDEARQRVDLRVKEMSEDVHAHNEIDVADEQASLLSLVEIEALKRGPGTIECPLIGFDECRDDVDAVVTVHERDHVFHPVDIAATENEDASNRAICDHFAEDLDLLVGKLSLGACCTS